MRPSFAFSPVLVAAALVSACGHSKGSAELSDDAISSEKSHLSDEEQERYMRPTASKTIGEPKPEEPPPLQDPTAPRAPALATAAPSGPYVPACPLQCWMAPSRHAVSPEETAQIQSALTPTMAALRQCNGGRYSRGSPTVNLRFNASGDLADIGVDTSNFDSGSEQCFQDVVRGGNAQPALKHIGPMTIRCAERCVAVHGKKRGK